MKKAERRRTPIVPPIIKPAAERRLEPRPGADIKVRQVGRGKLVTHGPKYTPPPTAKSGGGKTLKEMSKGAPRSITRQNVPRDARNIPRANPPAGTRVTPVGRVVGAAGSALKRFQLPVPIPALLEDAIGKRTGRKVKRA